MHVKVVMSAQRHLEQATEARSYMKAQVDASKADINRVFPSGPPIHSSLAPASNDLCNHYSFDFAQQVCGTLQKFHLMHTPYKNSI